jgi:ferredoxin
VTVDPKRCQGHARCWALAPDVFEIDDWGYSHAADVEVPPEHSDDAWRAVRACPEQAITVSEQSDQALQQLPEVKTP